MASDPYVGVSGAMARLQELDAIANNLANVDTTGFKRDRVAFTAALHSVLSETESPDPGRIFTLGEPAGVDLTAGTVSRTDAPLHAAISGPGFFEIDTPLGPRYTRAGSFSVNGDGLLASQDGHPVLGTSGPISIDERPASILASGEVTDSSGAVLGRLRVTLFEQPELLEKEGANRFRAPDGAASEAIPEPQLLERSLERSNVRPVEELANLVIVQRAFDLAVRTMQSDDEATERLIREISS